MILVLFAVNLQLVQLILATAALAPAMNDFKTQLFKTWLTFYVQ